MRLIDAHRLIEELNEAQVEGDELYKGLGKAKLIVCYQPTVAQEDSQESESYRIAITALNKQIGIKPYKIIWDNQETRILCPQCNYRFYSLIYGEKIAGNQSLYCPCCGQRIDWDDEEING